MPRETGTVKWFSNERGYGFIERSTGEDVFVHHSDIEGGGFKTLRAGERVEFEVVTGAKGPKAERVMRDGTSGTEARPQEGRSAGGRDGAGAAKGSSRTLAEQLREKLRGRFFGD